jgi:lipoprotein-releasing system permease protein
MPYEIFLALRYLHSRRRRTLARATTILSIIGIAFGVAALIAAFSLSNGFQDEMREKILSGTAHISLMRKDGEAMLDWHDVIAQTKTIQGVRDANGTTYIGALLNRGKLPAYIVLRGVDVESTAAIEEVKQTIVSGSIETLIQNSKDSQQSAVSNRPEDKSIPPAPTGGSQRQLMNSGFCFIGEELARRLNLKIGDEVEIVAADRSVTTNELLPVFMKLKVAGLFRTGLYEYDSTWIYVSLDTTSGFLGREQTAVPIISVEVTDIYKSKLIAEKIKEKLGAAYTTVDWQEANRPLFAALTLERRMGLFIISLLVLLAALNITTTLILVVAERRNDIAILGAMGSTGKSIMFVFILEGFFLGAIGSLCGVVFGLIVCWFGQRYKIVSLPADVYSISYVPFHTHITDVLFAVAVALVLSLIATIYPARAAVRMRPAEALRES